MELNHLELNHLISIFRDCLDKSRETVSEVCIMHYMYNMLSDTILLQFFVDLSMNIYRVLMGEKKLKLFFEILLVPRRVALYVEIH